MSVARGGQRLLARYSVMAPALFLLAALSGCSSDPGEGSQERARTSASGTAMFDGKPIPSGSVTFLHTESGTYANCPIHDGKYASVSGEGPVIGSNLTSVVGLQEPHGTPLWGGVWSQQVEITSDSFKQNFDIKPADTKPYVAPKPVNDPGSAGDEDKPLYE